MSQATLRITTQQEIGTVTIKIEGRLAGALISELQKEWLRIAPGLDGKRLTLDLRDMTFADASGSEMLRKIYKVAGAGFLASTPFTRFIADQAKEIIRTEDIISPLQCGGPRIRKRNHDEIPIRTAGC